MTTNKSGWTAETVHVQTLNKDAEYWAFYGPPIEVGGGIVADNLICTLVQLDESRFVINAKGSGDARRRLASSADEYGISLTEAKHKAECMLRDLGWDLDDYGISDEPGREPNPSHHMEENKQMKVDANDIAAVTATNIDGRTMVLDSLTSAIDYFEGRTDFTDAQGLMETFNNISEALGNMAVLHAWSAFHRAVKEAIASGNDTMEVVIEALTNSLVLRTAQLSDLDEDQLTAIYHRKVIQEVSHVISTCKMLVKAEEVTRGLCDAAAKSLGLSADEVFARLKAGDNGIGRVIGRIAMDRSIQKCRDEGCRLPPFPPGLLENIGMTLSDIPEDVRPVDNELRQLLDSLTKDAQPIIVPGTLSAEDERRIPRFPDNFNATGNGAQREGIKVGG